MNSRLDEMQAAILRARLGLLPQWTGQRRALAREYRTALAGATASSFRPSSIQGTSTTSSPCRSGVARDVQAHLRSAGIETLIHYPVPIPRQRAVAAEQPADCPVADKVCEEVFSLPLYPSLPTDAVRQVAAALTSR